MKYNIQHDKDPENIVSHAVAQASVNILHEVNAKAIIAFSVSGQTSKLISKQRPSKPVYAFTPSTAVYNRLSLIWGVTPLYVPRVYDTERIIDLGEKLLLKKKLINNDDIIIIVTGLALKRGSTNLIKIHTVGHRD